MRVLLVDDDPSVLQSISALLIHQGHEVDVASSGEVALGYLSGRRYELLLTDLEMPGVDGLQLAERARAVDSAIRVAVMSGDPQALACAAGRYPSLAKPFGLAVLRSLLAAS